MAMRFKLTKNVPKKEGYYWFSDGEEHTPCILYVSKCNNRLYADNHEFNFMVKKDSDCFWCPIPNPTLNRKEIKPFSN